MPHETESDMIAVAVLLVILVLLVFFVITQYNGLVRLRNETRNAWAQVDVVLRRRYDLVPNLVETVKGYAAHERETLEAVIQARSGAIDASAVTDTEREEPLPRGHWPPSRQCQTHRLDQSSGPIPTHRQGPAANNADRRVRHHLGTPCT